MDDYILEYIPFYPKSLNGAYGVNLSFERQGESEQHRLQFVARVVYCGQIDEYSIYHLSKEQFVAGDEDADDYLFTVAVECAEAAYPISVLTNAKGEIVFIRTDNVARKWPETRKRIEQYYKGEVIQGYLDGVEMSFNDESMAHQLIWEDLFFAQFFGLKSKEPNWNNPVLAQNELYLFPFSLPVKFGYTQTMNQPSFQDTDSDSFLVCQHGKTKDPYLLSQFQSEQMIRKGLPDVEMNAIFDASYELKKSSFEYLSLSADYTVYASGPEPYYSVHMQAYRLWTESVLPEPDDYFSELANRKIKKESALWKEIKYLFTDFK